ncbi:hypothetical protein JZ751_019114 [Albula glossodonta]|uniref:Uncharacterized protein n=1 Tax=Albula glossodonta TaxID=121402 RepID=A0A8T2NMX1_9TELE|nr:hypothetical protein JZ751_019114 [Albula glossodonta]
MRTSAVAWYRGMLERGMFKYLQTASVLFMGQSSRSISGKGDHRGNLSLGEERSINAPLRSAAGAHQTGGWNGRRTAGMGTTHVPSLAVV